jgi:hypothetical protein
VTDAKQRHLIGVDGGIIRVEKRERWLTIENDTVRDKRLTFGARGLLSYLLSHPNKWEVKVPYLIKQSPAGRDAIYGLLRELERFRYLVRKKRHGAKGRIYWASTIYETPQGEPLSDKELQQLHGGRPKKTKGDTPPLPLTGFPYTVEPDTARPDAVAPDTANPDTARPDTANTDAYVLPSDESPNDESLTASGHKTPDTPTQETAALKRGVGVSGCFTDEQYESYIDECVRRGEKVENPGGLLNYLRRGEMDARVRKILGDIEARAPGAQKCAPTCPKCFGSGQEIVPGKGARPCSNRKVS